MQETASWLRLWKKWVFFLSDDLRPLHFLLQVKNPFFVIMGFTLARVRHGRFPCAVPRPVHTSCSTALKKVHHNARYKKKILQRRGAFRLWFMDCVEGKNGRLRLAAHFKYIFSPSSSSTTPRLPSLACSALLWSRPASTVREAKMRSSLFFTHSM